MPSETTKIVDFMRAQVARDDLDEGARLRKIVVSHVVKGNKIGDEILTISVPESPQGEWFEEKASRILEQAASEALTLGMGPQVYAIHSYFGEEKARGRHVFTVAGADDTEDSISTEGPDAEGLVSLSMGMARDFAHLGTAGMKWQLRALLEDNQALRGTLAKKDATIESMQLERLKSIKWLEELQTASVERELRVKREALKEKLLDDAASKMSIVLPMVLNHLAGKKIFPETAANTLALKNFGESLSKDQFGMLQQHLTPEQYALFLQTLMSVSKAADDPPPEGQPNSLAQVSPSTLAKNGAPAK